jgi:multicomponent Na+:H+ antiporter subunit E
VHLALYLIEFTVALLRSNLDVARRVLTPSLPIRPAVVEVETRLKSSLGRMLLANSITLTPGTLSIDIVGDRILVHWIDCPPGTDLAGATREISQSFERHIAGFLR